MGKIAFIIGEWFVYWSPLILLLAALAAALAFLALRQLDGDALWRGVLLVLLALTPSLVLGRLIYWYCRPDSFQSLYEAMTGMDGSCLALVGAFAGCLLAACIGRVEEAMPQA